MLRQDLQQALKVLGQDEIDDAHALLRDHGFHPGDFEIVQRANPSPEYPSAITGAVTLIHKGTGASRTYQAGHGTAWLAELEADLKLGIF